MNQVETKLDDEIRRIHESEPDGADSLIEHALERHLDGLSVRDKMDYIEKMAQRFDTRADALNLGGLSNRKVLKTFSFLLGESLSTADLSSEDLIQRLGESLNTLFDELNKLVSEINKSFYGIHNPENTIRQAIKYHMQEGIHPKALEDFIGQIKQAFIIAHESFKHSVNTVVGNILDELEPEKVKTSEGGLFRKTKPFALYEEKYGTLKEWHESERFIHDFLVEFEKNCQRLT